MNGPRLPEGFRFESLARTHRRRQFRCGREEVDAWLADKALQNQKKNLSATKVLLTGNGEIAGFYTLATGQVDFGDLPPEMTKQLPRRLLPVAVLARLGVDKRFQEQGLGRRLLAEALRNCREASRSFPFVAVVLDCLDDEAKAFYRQWDFREMPGRPYRLFLSAGNLARILGSSR